MGMPTIGHIRAFTLRGAGTEYHDQGRAHRIDDHIATPMSRYPEYRTSRQSFGLNVLGALVVEVEASDGTVGFSVTTGGDLGCWIVEMHLAHFVEGRQVTAGSGRWPMCTASSSCRMGPPSIATTSSSRATTAPSPNS